MLIGVQLSKHELTGSMAARVVHKIFLSLDWSERNGVIIPRNLFTYYSACEYKRMGVAVQNSSSSHYLDFQVINTSTQADLSPPSFGITSI
jgi:hypothetical protein